jgi:hypothetical protein
MDKLVNRFLEKAADFLARWPGLLPLLGIALVLLNFLLSAFLGTGIWIVDVNLFLHLGLIIAICGLLIIRPLG